MISNYPGAQLPCISLARAASGAYQALVGVNGTSPVTASISADSYTGTGYEFVAMTLAPATSPSTGWVLTLYRAHAGLALTSTSTASTVGPAGTSALYIGHSADTTFIGAIHVACAGIVAEAWTSAQVTENYAAIKATMAAWAHPIGI